MAQTNAINTRIQHKHDTEANWIKATTFIPKAGELIIYDVDNTHAVPRFKVGDGVTLVSNLPFSNDTIDSLVSNKVDKVSGKGLSTNDYTTAEKNKLAGITAGAEPNQNAFSIIKIGNGDQQIAADVKSDTLQLVGSNVTLTPDVSNDKLTIGITKSNITSALGFTPISEGDAENIATAKTEELGEGFANVIYQMYGEDFPEEGDAPTIRNIANNAANAALASANSYTDTVASSKANSVHNHDDRYYTETEINSKLSGKSDTDHTHSNYVPTSRTVNGKALSSNISLTATDVGALPSTTSIPDSLSDLTSDSTHRTVTDTEKATWNAKSNFSGSYNDLTNKPTIPSISGLASTSYVDTAVSNKVDKVSGKGLSTNDYTTTEKNKLAAIEEGAQVNQNAFSNVIIGSTTIAADSKTDSLTITAGTGISITGDATNDAITITNSGVRSISTGTANGTISVNTNGTAANVAVKGLGTAAYTASTAYDSAGTGAAKADAALAAAKKYTDDAVAGLVDSSPDTLNTLNELAAALGDDPNFATTIAGQIGGKVDKVSGKGLSTNDYTTTEKNKLAGIASGAEVNQNAFSNIVIGEATISADTKTDTLTLVAGTNITLTPDATNDKITITATNTTYSAAGSSLGLVKSGGDVTISSGVITVKDDSHAHVISNVDGLQTALDGKSNSGHTHVISNIDGLQTALDGKSNSGHTHSISNINELQNTLDNKSDSGHTHSVSHTPAGTVSKPTFTGSAVNSEAPSDTATVYSITAVGSLPSLTTSVANKCLTLTFGAGTLPTKGSGVSVSTGAHTHSVTAAGTVSQPTFTGTAASLTTGADN